MENVKKQAADLYGQGFNCAQAVMYACRHATGLDERASLRLGSSFGGGMGNLQEMCGALTGAFMVAGMVKGFSPAWFTEQARSQCCGPASCRRFQGAIRFMDMPRFASAERRGRQQPD